MGFFSVGSVKVFLFHCFPLFSRFYKTKLLQENVLQDENELLDIIFIKQLKFAFIALKVQWNKIIIKNTSKKVFFWFYIFLSGHSSAIMSKVHFDILTY